MAKIFKENKCIYKLKTATSSSARAPVTENQETRNAQKGLQNNREVLQIVAEDPGLQHVLSPVNTRLSTTSRYS